MLLCDGGQRCQDDFHKRERSGGVKISQELMNALFSKTLQICEHSPLDVSIEVKKGGHIQVNLIMCLNTFSVSGTIIVSI